ncbi:Protein of unknown function [Streptomyces sp. 2231.1]|nr:Protein of unknown function [Streptomyces sp. 2231.1]
MPANAHPDADADAASTPAATAEADAETAADTRTDAEAQADSQARAARQARTGPAGRPADAPSPATAGPCAEAETQAEARTAAVGDPGELPGVPPPPGRPPRPRSHHTGHLRPAHHRSRDRRRRGAAPALTRRPAHFRRYLLSDWLVLVLAMLGACAVVVVVTLVRHKRAPDDEDPSETPDVIEYMTMWIGVVYAIVLGLAIAGVWEARSAAQDYVQNEAQALHEISERVRVYPPDVRDRIRDDLDAYVSYVVHTEWKAMADDEQVTDRGTELLQQVRQDVTDYQPRNDFEAQAYQPLLDQLATADQARNARAGSTGPTMPPVVWWGLLAGAVITIGMVFALQIRRTTRELVLAGLFSATIAFMLFLIWDLDAPYSRGIAVTADPFLNLFPAITS